MIYSRDILNLGVTNCIF